MITIKAEGISLKLEFETKEDVDPGGNANYPTRVVFDFGFQGEVSIVEFWGTWEFEDFRRALQCLDRELTAVLGPLDSSPFDAEVEQTITRVPRRITP